jgi:hypothetical protein
VIREYEVGRKQLSDDTRVRVDVARAFAGVEVLQELRLEPFVAVEDEDGQDAAGQLGDDDACGAEVIPLRTALLADDGDVVSGVGPRSRELARIDVRSGTCEQVPVPEDDSQVRWK